MPGTKAALYGGQEVIVGKVAVKPLMDDLLHNLHVQRYPGDKSKISGVGGNPGLEDRLSDRVLPVIDDVRSIEAVVDK